MLTLGHPAELDGDLLGHRLDQVEAEERGSRGHRHDRADPVGE
jgi:hypothetical protein